VQNKGQITIPSEFREALGIGSETLLSMSVSGDRLEITPLRHGDEALRSYTDSDIERFLREDRLDEETAKKVRALLKRGEL
jgi:AbrB family looped-hinge helix DNA binding protein